MSTAICFNLDQSKILSSGNGIKKKHLNHMTVSVNFTQLWQIFPSTGNPELFPLLALQILIL